MPPALNGLLANPYLQWIGAQIKQMTAILAALKTNAPMPARDVLVYTLALVVIVVIGLKLATRERKTA